jgi:hypothetical protein
MLKQIDNPAGALAFARHAVEATTWEKIVEAWKAGILSGPITHVANVIGNTTFAALRVPVDVVASGIGRLHGGERVSAMEPIARVYGNLQGVADALRYAGAAMESAYERGGLKEVVKEVAVGKEEPGKTEQFRKAIEGTKGDVIRLPFRGLQLADALFSTAAERAEAHTLAVRQATTEGLNPLTREFRERIAALVQDPTKEMAEQIQTAGKRFTFNTELGDFGQKVQALTRAEPFGMGVKPLQFFVPFVRTPGNIVKELGRMTPLAPLVREWREDIAKGGVARDKALAELTVGMGISTIVFIHALEGNITGAGEPDRGKRLGKTDQWQPYSIKIGGTWYNYQRLQPVGTLIGMAADVAEVWDHLTEEESDKVPKMLAVAFANAVTNQTFLQGVTSMVNSMSEPGRFGPKLVQQLVGSAVPAIVAQPAQMLDPVQREVYSVLDAVKSRIPVIREGLLPKRDVFGEPMPSKERLGGISPVTTLTPSDDKVRQEMARLNVSVADTPKKTHLGRAQARPAT